MARKRMVSRTLTVTRCVVMVVNEETAEVSNIVVDLGGRIEDKKEALKMVIKNNKSGLTPVTVVSIEYKQFFAHMPEAEFLEYATLEELTDAE